MSRLSAKPNLSNVTDLEDLKRYTQQFLSDVFDRVNGQLEYDLNLRTKTVSVTFAASNTQVAVGHNLGKTPTGFIVAGLSVSATIYNGTTAFDKSNIYIKASAPCTAKVIIF